MSLKDLSGRLARWSLQLQAFDFEIQHRKGSENIVADMMSQAPINKEIDELTMEEFLDFETTEFENDEYRDLIKTINENSQQLPDLKVDNGMIYKKCLPDQIIGDELQWKLWLPTSITHEIIDKAHAPLTACHGGITKTLERIKRFFYWPNMTTQVRQYVKNCQKCQESKASNQHLMPGIGKEVITDRPFQKLCIDFLRKYPRSKKGNAYIFLL